VVAEALGLALPHSALAPSGQPVWTELAVRSARALVALEARGLRSADSLTSGSIRNAMAVHAAFGGSTNLLLHIPAIAHAAGLPRPVVDDWIAINRQVPRLVDALPNGPIGHSTVRVFLAGGVPEVMLHLRELGVIEADALTASGVTWGEALDAWASSERRARFRERLREQDGVDPDEVILSPDRAKARGLTSTVTFPRGNLAPEGAVIKSTAIDPSVIGADGVFRHEGPVRVFASEKAAMAAIKRGAVVAGDVLVLAGIGPLGTGMEETYQVTSALKHLPFGKHVTLLTDGRFSGVSTGACVGHIGPEALAGGPLGRLRDGDRVCVVVDCRGLEGSVDFVGDGEERLSADRAAAVLAARPANPELAPAAGLPDDTRLWAALQQASGGTWGGCVYDLDAVTAALGQRGRT
jgi:putative YjhG/YagF family dehydratase